MDFLLTTPTKTFAMKIREASALDLMHIRRYKLDKHDTPHPDPDANILLAFFYAILVNTSAGEVPTEDEFLGLSNDKFEEWYDAVDEVNPDLLPKAEDPTSESPITEEELEKKELKPTQSLSE